MEYGDFVDIPGFPTYQINQMAEVRRLWIRGNSKVPKPLILKSRRINGHDIVRMEKDGKRIHMPIPKLMAITFSDGVPDGKVICHKNGNIHDHVWNNIVFLTRSEAGKKYGKDGSRKPVAKITPDGEPVAFYKSAREAAKKNNCSDNYVINRCRGKVKKEFADGFSFRWER